MSSEVKMIKMQSLVQQLNLHGHRYYTEDNPTISDQEYDRLYAELQMLESELDHVLPQSPTQRVGGELLKGFRPHRHLKRLLSLDKAKDLTALTSWMTRVDKLIANYNSNHATSPLPPAVYVVEYKFDGLSLNLTYEKGILQQAATRGDGEVGEAILPQVRTIRSVPLSIAYTEGKLEVQGEGFMRLSVFHTYNENSQEPFKNARNAAAGALRNLNSKITAARKLDAFFYQVGYVEGKTFTSHRDMISFLQENSFPVSPHIRYFRTPEEVKQEMDEIENQRMNLDYLIDGVVVKVNDIRTRQVLGDTDKFPRWALAYKFAAEETTTVLKNVTWEVGRTGKITPLARVEPVELAGVTVKNCTLNNVGDIQRKNLLFAINSRVFIRRSNDVIPEILGKADEKSGEEICVPKCCPSCDAELERRGAHLYCPNGSACRPQIIGRLTHFAARNSMDIETFSVKTALQLFEQLHVRELADLYALSESQLLQLPRFGERKAHNLIQAIESSKTRPLSAFINALGIPNTGKTTAKMLADYYNDLKVLMSASKEELLSLKDIGQIVADSIYDYFHNPANKANIERMLALGVKPQPSATPTPIKEVNPHFLGKTIVLSGSFMDWKRAELEKQLEALGGKVTNHVSKKTDLLIVGEQPGSKLAMAQQLGILILDEKNLKLILKKE